MLRFIQLSIPVLAMTMTGIACASQGPSTPQTTWFSPGPVANGPLLRGKSPFDCRIDSVRSWVMAGSAPDHYHIARVNALAWLAEDSCRTGWRIESTQQTRESDFAVVPYSFSAQHYQGKRIRYSAVLQTEGVTGGAGLVARVDDANGKVLAFDDMRTRALIGTVQDTRYDVVLEVPESASTIMVGLVLVGNGTVSANKLRIEAVGADVPVTDTLSSVTQSTTK